MAIGIECSYIRPDMGVACITIASGFEKKRLLPLLDVSCLKQHRGFGGHSECSMCIRRSMP